MSQTNAYIPGLRAAVGHGLPGRPTRSAGAWSGAQQGISFASAQLGQPGRVFAGSVYSRQEFASIASRFPGHEPGQLLNVPASLSGSHNASQARGGAFVDVMFNPSRTRVAGRTDGLNSASTYSVRGVFVWQVGTDTFGEVQLTETASSKYAFTVLGWASDNLVLVERVTLGSQYQVAAIALLVYNVATGSMVAVGSPVAAENLNNSFQIVHIDATHVYVMSGPTHVKVSRSNGSAASSTGTGIGWGRGPRDVCKMWPADGSDPNLGVLSMVNHTLNAFTLRILPIIDGVIRPTSITVLNTTGSGTNSMVPLLGAVAVLRAGIAYCFYPDGTYELKPKWLALPEAFWNGSHPYPALRVCLYQGNAYRYDMETASLSPGVPVAQPNDALYPFAPGFAPQDITQDIGHKGIKTSAYVPYGQTSAKTLSVYNADSQFWAMPEPGVMEVLP